MRVYIQKKVILNAIIHVVGLSRFFASRRSHCLDNNFNKNLPKVFFIEKRIDLITQHE